ncbi:MAG TPA: TniB family NTP-binding protein [Azonexus sp.]|nr:TniB family NTP-binding protein [Azonexus sp.]
MTPDIATGKSVFRITGEPFKHARFLRAIDLIEEVHHCQRKYGKGEGVLIMAPPGAGKSTIAEAYMKEHGREYHAESTRVPVLLVKVPESPTAGRLAEAILIALGDPVAHRGDTPRKTERIYRFIEGCGVEMILFDEFHHLFYAPTLPEFRKLTDWFKIFLDDARIGTAGFGLSESAHVVDANPQLRRRFSAREWIRPFILNEEGDFREFRSLLRNFETELPLPCETPIHETNMARRFHVASFGLLDYVVKTLEGGVSVAQAAGLSTITLPALAAGFRKRVWQDVPERLNPFFPESPLRSLDRAGEVFASYAHGDALGSPLGRRLGVTTSRKGIVHAK